MARNQVQFQKGLSEASFGEIYGTEEQCHAALVKWRWAKRVRMSWVQWRRSLRRHARRAAFIPV